MLRASPANPPQMSTYLLSTRLPRPSPHTKHKTLLLLKHLLTSGHPQFNRACQGQINRVKELTSYVTKLDPVRGDEMQRNIRKLAGEVIEAVYADVQETRGGRVMEGENNTGREVCEMRDVWAE